MHTAMLLGAAQVLSGMKEEFAGTVKLIFQPSEENAADSGVKRMITDGVLENPRVDAIFAQHVSPNYPTGSVALNEGAMSASSDRFFIRIHDKSSHGSAPENGIDAVTIGAQVITALQTIVSRFVSPLDNVVPTIGKLIAGSPVQYYRRGMCDGRCLPDTESPYTGAASRPYESHHQGHYREHGRHL